MYILIALFIIILKAIADGLALAHHKEIAGIIEFVWQSGMILTLYAFFTGVLETQRRDLGKFLKVIGGFLLLRFAVFSVILNICAGLEWNYIGNTKLFDIIINKFFTWSGFPHNFLLWPYLFALIGGITLLHKKRERLILGTRRANISIPILTVDSTRVTVDSQNAIIYSRFKWYIPAIFGSLIVAGIVLKLLGKSALIPTIIFGGLLLIWFIISMIIKK